MISLIISDNNNVNLFELNKLFKNNKLVKISLVFDNNQWDIINEISQTNIFGDEKCFVIFEAIFLADKKSFDVSKKLIEFLINNTDKNIICIVNSKKIFENELITKLLKKSNLIKPKKNNDYSKNLLIDDLVREYGISVSKSVLDMFKNRLPLDSYCIEGEVNKLIFSKNQFLDESVIENQIFDYNNNNIFNLLILVLTKKYEMAFKLFDNLINLKFLTIELIQIMASQLYTVKLIKLGMINSLSNNTILSKLSISNFQLILQREMLYNSISLIDRLLDDLLDFDLKIKLGKVEPQLGFKLMILK